jgi:hypothetical protein
MYRYFIHLAVNWKVAGKSLLMFFFHFIHGLFPVRATEHEFWGIDDTGRVKEE